jgi:hypothetical protein
MLNLQQFMGGGDQFRHITGLLYTEGVQHLAEEAGAYWLIDAIASYQGERVLRAPRLREFQLWELEVKDQKGVLTCREDSDLEPVIRQEIEYTDFPLPEIKLYVEGGVLLLPSEH